MNKRKRRLLPFFLSAAGALMILAAVGLIAFNEMESARAGESAAAVAEEFERIIEEAQVQGDPSAAAEEVQEVQIDGTYYMGILSIPSLGRKLPVQKQYSESALKVSPCRFAGSLDGGDLVIAGHNYESHFGSLQTLSPGDAVVFQTASGERISYTVDYVETLQAWQIEQMMFGEWDLTLFTCTPSGQMRVAVRCLAETFEPAQQEEVTK